VIYHDTYTLIPQRVIPTMTPEANLAVVTLLHINYPKVLHVFEKYISLENSVVGDTELCRYKASLIVNRATVKYLTIKTSLNLQQYQFFSYQIRFVRTIQATWTVAFNAISM
jgi:hypothetical protein